MAKKAKFEPVTSEILADYIFSEAEKRQIAQELANKNIEIQGLGDEKTAVMSNFKAKIDQATAQVNLLATHLAQGKEQRFFKCYLAFDPVKKERLWKELKTHKLIKTEAMKPEDYQIKFGEKPPKK